MSKRYTWLSVVMTLLALAVVYAGGTSFFTDLDTCSVVESIRTTLWSVTSEPHHSAYITSTLPPMTGEPASDTLQVRQMEWQIVVHGSGR